MRNVKELTLDFVNKNFYECEGKVFRKDGKKLTNNVSNGYYTVWFNSKYYYVHRILWVIYNKESIPEDYFIDHVDGDSTNNSKENLRLATICQNNHNRKVNKNNKLGLKGISIWTSKSNTTYFRCQIRKNNITKEKIFSYNSEGLIQAKLWLEEQREQLHGEFSRSE